MNNFDRQASRGPASKMPTGMLAKRLVNSIRVPLKKGFTLRSKFLRTNIHTTVSFNYGLHDFCKC